MKQLIPILCILGLMFGGCWHVQEKSWHQKMEEARLETERKKREAEAKGEMYPPRSQWGPRIYYIP